MARLGQVPESPGVSSAQMPNLISDTRIHQRLVRIPSDQQSLLNRPDAWLMGGLVNVPPQVLDDVKKFHTRKGSLPPPEASPPPPASASPIATVATRPHTPRQSLGTRGIHSGSSPNKSQENGEDTDDAETFMSWEESPDRELPPKGEENGVSSRSQSIAASPEQGPPDRAPRTLSKPTIMTTLPPSSSPGDDAELEMEVPGAITDVISPVNKAALLVPSEPTPPSAQIIPCTYPSSNRAPTESSTKRRRLTKELKFDDIPRVADHRPSVLATSMILPPVPKPFESQSSASPSSSPRIPGTAPAPRTPGPREATQNEALLDETVATPETPPEVNSSPILDVSRPSGISSVGSPSLDPFITFAVSYPSYKASLGTFVKGVICLQGIEKKRQLPSFLFDDFIRIFSDDYIDYIDNIDEDQPVMTAVQWYNENVRHPAFVKNIVSKDNIQDILDLYHKEVDEARQSLSGSEEPEADGTSVKPGVTEALYSAKPVVTASAEELLASESEHASPPFRDTSRQFSQLESDITIARSDEPQPSPSSPDSTISKANSASRKENMDASRVFGMTVSAATVTPRGPLPTARLPSTQRSESIPDTVIKSKRPPSQGANSAVGSPPKNQKRKKVQEDPEMRRERFKTFLRERIRSSGAPSSSAPG